MRDIEVKNTEVKDYFPGITASNLVKTILFNLGFDEEKAREFLSVKTAELEDPFHIFGMKKAAEVIEKYIQEKKKIIIHGDFDVDGVCATTILWEYLYFIRKADAFPIIPNRADEGYGLSEKTIQKAIDMGGNLIITVDCGIKDAEIVDRYKDKIDFLITDHHQFLTDENGEIVLPKAKAVVHSAHPKSKFSTMISGGATAWEVVRAIEISRNPENSYTETVLTDPVSSTSKSNRSLFKSNESKNFPDYDTETFNPNDFLDLVAISTICDIIPLSSENRKLVLKGIEKIAENKRLGLDQLMKVAAVDPEKIESYHFGFVLGPRINAPGRVLNDAMHSMRLLSTKNLLQARELAKKLDDLNLQRQELTRKYLELAEKQIDLNKKALVIRGEEWPEGILGLIAGKLAEKHFRPVLVASTDEEGKITGSSRSPLDSFYLNKALEHAKDHLTRFGGHKQAAGFASEKEIFEGFEEKILEFIEANSNQKDFERKLIADIEILDYGEIDFDAVYELKSLEPFGLGNPKPVFLFRNCKIIDIQEFGKTFAHLKLVLQHNNSKIIAKGFNMVEKFEDLKLGLTVDLLGCLSINEWNGNRTIEVDIKEIILN